MSASMPIRCFECAAVIGNKWELYWSLAGINVEKGFVQEKNINPCHVLDKMGILKVCCRNMFLTSVDYSYMPSHYEKK
jgi:DNA-directed RNA polymerase subunit N (RpoN/RPB10)